MFLKTKCLSISQFDQLFLSVNLNEKIDSFSAYLSEEFNTDNEDNVRTTCIFLLSG